MNIRISSFYLFDAQLYYNNEAQRKLILYIDFYLSF